MQRRPGFIRYFLLALIVISLAGIIKWHLNPRLENSCSQAILFSIVTESDMHEIAKLAWLIAAATICVAVSLLYTTRSFVILAIVFLSFVLSMLITIGICNLFSYRISLRTISFASITMILISHYASHYICQCQCVEQPDRSMLLKQLLRPISFSIGCIIAMSIILAWSIDGSYAGDGIFLLASLLGATFLLLTILSHTTFAFIPKNIKNKEPARNKLVSWFSNFVSRQGVKNAHSFSSAIEKRRRQEAKGQSKWVNFFFPAPKKTKLPALMIVIVAVILSFFACLQLGSIRLLANGEATKYYRTKTITNKSCHSHVASEDFAVEQRQTASKGQTFARIFLIVLFLYTVHHIIQPRLVLAVLIPFVCNCLWILGIIAWLKIEVELLLVIILLVIAIEYLIFYIYGYLTAAGSEEPRLQATIQAINCFELIALSWGGLCLFPGGTLPGGMGKCILIVATISYINTRLYLPLFLSFLNEQRLRQHLLIAQKSKPCCLIYRIKDLYRYIDPYYYIYLSFKLALDKNYLLHCLLAEKNKSIGYWLWFRIFKCGNCLC